MAAQKKTKASKYLTVPTRPVPIDRDRSVAGLLEKMEGAGFGAKQLAEAHRIWLDMLDDNSTIYLCGSGNLITSGMRRLLAYVIKNRFVDVIVMSGTVLFHDIHYNVDKSVLDNVGQQPPHSGCNQIPGSAQVYGRIVVEHVEPYPMSFRKLLRAETG